MMKTQQNIVVREYGSAHDYAKDARSMARQGWKVASVTTSQKRGLINFLLFFWPRKSVTVVTYERV